MEIADLQLIQRNDTSLNVLKFLSKRERISSDTNLESFKHFLIKSGINVNKDEFFKLFKDLEGAGVGKLVPYQHHSEGKFIWYYSLRDVSEQVLNPNKLIEIKPIGETNSSQEQIEAAIKVLPSRPVARKKCGRPKGYSPKTKTVINQPDRELIYMFSIDSGEFFPLRLKDAEKIAAQVVSIRLKQA